jgi:hypothetical protein
MSKPVGHVHVLTREVKLVQVSGSTGTFQSLTGRRKFRVLTTSSKASAEKPKAVGQVRVVTKREVWRAHNEVDGDPARLPQYTRCHERDVRNQAYWSTAKRLTVRSTREREEGQSFVTTDSWEKRRVERFKERVYLEDLYRDVVAWEGHSIREERWWGFHPDSHMARVSYLDARREQGWGKGSQGKGNLEVRLSLTTILRALVLSDSDLFTRVALRPLGRQRGPSSYKTRLGACGFDVSKLHSVSRRKEGGVSQRAHLVVGGRPEERGTSTLGWWKHLGLAEREWLFQVILPQRRRFEEEAVNSFLKSTGCTKEARWADPALRVEALERRVHVANGDSTDQRVRLCVLWKAHCRVARGWDVDTSLLTGRYRGLSRSTRRFARYFGIQWVLTVLAQGLEGSKKDAELDVAIAYLRVRPLVGLKSHSNVYDADRGTFLKRAFEGRSWEEKREFAYLRTRDRDVSFLFAQRSRSQRAWVARELLTNPRGRSSLFSTIKARGLEGSKTFVLSDHVVAKLREDFFQFGEAVVEGRLTTDVTGTEAKEEQAREGGSYRRALVYAKQRGVLSRRWVLRGRTGEYDPARQALIGADGLPHLAGKSRARYSPGASSSSSSCPPGWPAYWQVEGALTIAPTYTRKREDISWALEKRKQGFVYIPKRKPATQEGKCLRKEPSYTIPANRWEVSSVYFQVLGRADTFYTSTVSQRIWGVSHRYRRGRRAGHAWLAFESTRKFGDSEQDNLLVLTHGRTHRLLYLAPWDVRARPAWLFGSRRSSKDAKLLLGKVGYDVGISHSQVDLPPHLIAYLVDYRPRRRGGTRKDGCGSAVRKTMLFCRERLSR